MGICVITGASSGLGREYALAVIKHRPEIDEFWLIARRRDRLEALASELPGKAVRILTLDLTDRESYRAYQEALDQRSGDVELLINNAGYGKLGDFCEQPYQEQCGMVALNDGALTALTGITLRHMSAGGVIVNVCSIAAFAPTPRMTVYSATKAYAFAFSKGLRAELKSRGINVLAACPGPMDTEFLDVANISGRSKLFASLPRVNPKEIAEKSLRRAYAGRSAYTGTLVYRAYRVLCKLLPHGLMMRFTRA